MTDFDPPYVPDHLGSHDFDFDGRGAYYHHDQHRLRVPQIPDLRFEQAYLFSIRQFVSTEAPDSAKASQFNEKGGLQVAKASDSLYGVPLRIDWGGVAWVTLRDQVVYPLLQGAAWGTVSVFLVPLGLRVKTSLFGPPGTDISPSAGFERSSSSSNREISPWRQWFRNLLGGAGIQNFSK